MLSKSGSYWELIISSFCNDLRYKVIVKRITNVPVFHVIHMQSLHLTLIFRNIKWFWWVAINAIFDVSVGGTKVNGKSISSLSGFRLELGYNYSLAATNIHNNPVEIFMFKHIGFNTTVLAAFSSHHPVNLYIVVSFEEIQVNIIMGNIKQCHPEMWLCFLLASNKRKNSKSKAFFNYATLVFAIITRGVYEVIPLIFYNSFFDRNTQDNLYTCRQLFHLKHLLLLTALGVNHAFQIINGKIVKEGFCKRKQVAVCSNIVYATVKKRIIIHFVWHPYDCVCQEITYG